MTHPEGRAPEPGDRVFHHGHYHTIRRVHSRPRMVDGAAKVLRFAEWENESYLVAGFHNELEWSEELGAWYLPGRILSRNERALAETITGQWPPAASHASLVPMLDAVPLATVNRERFAEVLLRRKADLRHRLEAGLGEDPEDWRKADGELKAAAARMVSEYVDAALEQFEAIRSNRREG